MTDRAQDCPPQDCPPCGQSCGGQSWDSPLDLMLHRKILLPCHCFLCMAQLRQPKKRVKLGRNSLSFRSQLFHVKWKHNSFSDVDRTENSLDIYDGRISFPYKAFRENLSGSVWGHLLNCSGEIVCLLLFIFLLKTFFELDIIFGDPLTCLFNCTIAKARYVL